MVVQRVSRRKNMGFLSPRLFPEVIHSDLEVQAAKKDFGRGRNSKS